MIDRARFLLPQLRVPLHFLQFVFRNFMRNEGLENAKSLTFTSLFAVVPLLTLIVSVLSAFPSFQVFGAQVQEMIYERLLPSTSSELQGYLAGFAGQARNLTWAGAVMLFGTAYLMLVNIERNFNRIWGVSEQRKGITSFLLYWSVLSLGPLLLGVGLAISSYVTSLTLFDRFSELTLLGGHSILGLFPVLLTTVAFTLLYAAVPNCGVRLRHAVAGALAVALAFIVVKWVFARFMTQASYALIYGTFAAIPVFLVWLYVCWVVILLGANLVRSIPLYGSRLGGEDVHPSLLLLALLHKLWEKQQSGDVLRVTELLAEKWPFRRVTADGLLSWLEEKQLIHALGDDAWVLARDLEGLTVWEVLAEAPWGLPSQDDLGLRLPAVVSSHVPELADLCARFRHVNELAAEELGSPLGVWFRRSS